MLISQNDVLFKQYSNASSFLPVASAAPLPVTSPAPMFDIQDIAGMTNQFVITTTTSAGASFIPTSNPNLAGTSFIPTSIPNYPALVPPYVITGTSITGTSTNFNYQMDPPICLICDTVLPLFKKGVCDDCRAAIETIKLMFGQPKDEPTEV